MKALRILALPFLWLGGWNIAELTKPVHSPYALAYVVVGLVFGSVLTVMSFYEEERRRR